MDELDDWQLIARSLAGETNEAEEASLHRRARRDRAFAAKLEAARRAPGAARGPGSGVDTHAAWLRMEARMRTEADSSDTVAARPRSRGVRRAAAIMAVAAGAAFVMLFRPGTEPAPEAPTAAAGVWTTEGAAGRTLTLDDGSVVRLGPASRLESASDPRTLHLDGLAFFAVEHDETKPFTVRSTAGTIRVLGTRFEVRSGGDSVRVLVIEGSVALSGETGDDVILGAGDHGVVVRGEAPAVTTPPATGPGSWLGRVLVFKDTPLRDVVAEVATAYGTVVTIEDPMLDTLRVSALFDDRPLAEVMETICRITSTSCTVTPDSAAIR